MSCRWTLAFVVFIATWMCLLNQGAMALKCYACTANTGGTDCEKNVAAVAIVDCNKRYCTTRRIENKATNQVTSFYRSCEDNPMYTDKVIEDDTYRTFFRACSTELCNGGTGKESYVPDGSGKLPAGVVKPPFNERVLHPFSSGALKLQANLSVFVFSVSVYIYVSHFI